MKYRFFLFSFLLMSYIINAQSLNDSLLLYYPFNGNANDESINGFDGIVHGAVPTTDRFGNPNSAYYFDGIDDYIELPNNDTLKPSLPVSFSMFVKHDDLDAVNCALFNTSFEDNRSTGVYSTIQNSTKKYAIGYGDGTYNYGESYRRSYISNSTIDTSWQFVVFVVEGPAEMNCFVKCNEFCGDYYGSGDDLFYSNYPGSIGRHDQDLWLEPYYFKGKIDDFRYWNRALTLNDIDSLCTVYSVYDTIMVYDTIPIYDSILFDTIPVFDTIPLYDTIPIFDTIPIYDSIAVTDTLIIDVDLPVDMYEIIKNTIKVYPNPTKDKLYINNGDYFEEMAGYSIKIVNLSGEIIFQSYFDNAEYVIDMNDFGETGLYLIKIIDPDQNTIDVRKILLY